MIDPVLSALRDYEKAVAPAYEVIRRARARLLEALPAMAAEPIPALYVWSRDADPTEPNNGAEYAVDAWMAGFTEQLGREPGSGPEGIPAPASQPERALEGGHAADALAPAPASQPAAAGDGEADDRARSASPIDAVTEPDGRASAAEVEGATSPPGGVPPPASCPRCPYRGSAHGLRVHQGRTGHTGAVVAPDETPAALPGDPREIDEACRHGCGRRFRWSPALSNHERTCSGPKEAVA